MVSNVYKVSMVCLYFVYVYAGVLQSSRRLKLVKGR